MASSNPASATDGAAAASPGTERTLGSPRRGGPGRSRAASLLAADRVLPHSVDAEVSVLGSMLISPLEAGSLARERLTETHFYQAAHQVLFREICTIQDNLQAIDQVTLSQRLRDKNLLEEVGGEAYLADLVMRVPTASNVEHYIDIVEEKHLLRRLIGSCAEIMGRCFEDQDDVRGLVDEVEKQLFEVTAETGSPTTRSVKDLIKDAMGSIEQLFDQRGALTGIPTGFRDLDKLTSGLHRSEMFVIAARPSVGKTALAVNIAEHVAVDRNLPVGIFSLEMSAEELVKRILCSRSKVNLRSMRDGFLRPDEDFPKLTTVASQLMRAPLFIDDSAGLTVHQVRARARRMKLQYDIQLLVIDYMQLMRAPSRRADQSRQVEISDISAGIKGLAKELQIPIIVLSQLNRQPEQREGGRPRLSDLRESGSIEQDADVVGLLVRPEMYEEDEQERASKKGEATLMIAKQRNGPTGDVELSFLKEFTRFEDRAKVEEEDFPGAERSEE